MSIEVELINWTGAPSKLGIGFPIWYKDIKKQRMTVATLESFLADAEPETPIILYEDDSPAEVDYAIFEQTVGDHPLAIIRNTKNNGVGFANHMLQVLLATATQHAIITDADVRIDDKQAISHALEVHDAEDDVFFVCPCITKFARFQARSEQALWFRSPNTADMRIYNNTHLRAVGYDDPKLIWLHNCDHRQRGVGMYNLHCYIDTRIIGSAPPSNSRYDEWGRMAAYLRSEKPYLKLNKRDIVYLNKRWATQATPEDWEPYRIPAMALAKQIHECLWKTLPLY